MYTVQLAPGLFGTIGDSLNMFELVIRNTLPYVIAVRLAPERVQSILNIDKLVKISLSCGFTRSFVEIGRSPHQKRFLSSFMWKWALISN